MTFVLAFELTHLQNNDYQVIKVSMMNSRTPVLTVIIISAQGTWRILIKREALIAFEHWPERDKWDFLYCAEKRIPERSVFVIILMGELISFSY